MMKNIGLEALAALASSVSAAACSNGMTNSHSYDGGESKNSIGPSASTSTGVLQDQFGAVTTSSSSSNSNNNKSHSHLVTNTNTNTTTNVGLSNHNHHNTSTNNNSNPNSSSSADHLALAMQNAAASLLQQTTMNFTPQQWHQMLSAATASTSSCGNSNSNMNTNQAVVLHQQQPVPPPPLPSSSSAGSGAGIGLSSLLSSMPNLQQIDPSTLLAVQQQLSIYQQLMQQQQQQQQQHQQVAVQQNSNTSTAQSGGTVTPNGASVNCNTVSNSTNTYGNHQHPPVSAASQSATNPVGLLSSAIAHHQQQPSGTTTTTMMAHPSHSPLQEITPHKAPIPQRQRLKQDHHDRNNGDSGCDDEDDLSYSNNNAQMHQLSSSSSTGIGGGTGVDKKQQKRAANRRSAQLSRKRKKAFIEELKDENDDLRRKEQILRSIPDLVVVFDSSGKLWFISESVNRFIDYTSIELEGTSFWNRLCDDSVRLLKAAFMDSLAGRTNEADTVPLGTGFWELALIDRDGSKKTVTLNGVVHFAGDRPECVCSIRPSQHQEEKRKGVEPGSSRKKDRRIENNTSNSVLISASSSSNAKGSIRKRPSSSSDDITVGANDAPAIGGGCRSGAAGRGGEGDDTVRISDSGNSSGSDSGVSEDIMNCGVVEE